MRGGSARRATGRNRKKLSVAAGDADPPVDHDSGTSQPTPPALGHSSLCRSSLGVGDQDVISGDCVTATWEQSNLQGLQHSDDDSGEEGLSFEELMSEPCESQNAELSPQTASSSQGFDGKGGDNATPSLKDLLGIVDEHMTLDILSEIEVSMEPGELQSLQEVDVSHDPSLVSV